MDTAVKTVATEDATDWSSYVLRPGEQPPDEAVGAALDALKDVKVELESIVLARQDVIQASLVALLTGEHILQLGAPGTAKSMLMNEIAKRVTDARTGQGLRTYTRLMDKFVTPEMLLGPIDVAAIRNGIYRHIWEGTLADADLVFLDEVFKSSTAILNALLLAINERQADVGTNLRIDIPLITMFLASNEGPTDVDALLAFYDRILLRLNVHYLEPEDFKTMMQSRVAVQRHKMYRQHGQWFVGEGDSGASDVPGGQATHAHLTRNQLYLLQQATNYVAVPPHVLDALVRLRAQLGEKGIIASDRRWSQLLPCLQAAALLRESPVVEDEDLLIMVHALWNRADDITEVRKQIRRVSNPQSAAIQEKFDMAQTAFSTYEKALNKATNEDERLRCTADMSTTLRNLRNELTALRDTMAANKQETGKADAAIAGVKKMLLDVSSKLANI